MSTLDEKKSVVETDDIVMCFLDLLHKQNYISNTCYFNAKKKLKEGNVNVTEDKI